MKRSRLALVRGDDRYGNVLQALECMEGGIDLAGKGRIVIKPDFVSVPRQLSATHADAVRAAPDFPGARGAEGVKK